VPTITISRQFGAGGADIGRRLADRLGLGYLDRELITATAERLRTTEVVVAAHDERTARLIDRIVASARLMYPPAAAESVPPSDHDAIVGTIEEVIRQAAEAGDVVIIGRGAHLVLRDRPDILRVLLVADAAVRLERLRGEGRMSPKATIEDMHAVDRERERHIAERFRVRADDPVAYELVLNTTRLAPDAAVRLIVRALELWRVSGSPPEVYDGGEATSPSETDRQQGLEQ
jgi:cytidylate kinase